MPSRRTPATVVAKRRKVHAWSASVAATGGEAEDDDVGTAGHGPAADEPHGEGGGRADRGLPWTSSSKPVAWAAIVAFKIVVRIFFKPGKGSDPRHLDDLFKTVDAIVGAAEEGTVAAGAAIQAAGALLSAVVRLVKEGSIVTGPAVPEGPFPHVVLAADQLRHFYHMLAMYMMCGADGTSSHTTLTVRDAIIAHMPCQYEGCGTNLKAHNGRGREEDQWSLKVKHSRGAQGHIVPHLQSAVDGGLGEAVKQAVDFLCSGDATAEEDQRAGQLVAAAVSEASAEATSERGSFTTVSCPAGGGNVMGSRDFNKFHGLLIYTILGHLVCKWIAMKGHTTCPSLTPQHVRHNPLSDETMRQLISGPGYYSWDASEALYTAVEGEHFSLETAAEFSSALSTALNVETAKGVKVVFIPIPDKIVPRAITPLHGAVAGEEAYPLLHSASEILESPNISFKDLEIESRAETSDVSIAIISYIAKNFVGSSAEAATTAGTCLEVAGAVTKQVMSVRRVMTSRKSAGGGESDGGPQAIHPSIATHLIAVAGAKLCDMAASGEIRILHETWERLKIALPTVASAVRALVIPMLANVACNSTRAYQLHECQLPDGPWTAETLRKYRLDFMSAFGGLFDEGKALCMGCGGPMTHESFSASDGVKSADFASMGVHFMRAALTHTALKDVVESSPDEAFRPGNVVVHRLAALSPCPSNTVYRTIPNGVLLVWVQSGGCVVVSHFHCKWLLQSSPLPREAGLNGSRVLCAPIPAGARDEDLAQSSAAWTPGDADGTTATCAKLKALTFEPRPAAAYLASIVHRLKQDDSAHFTIAVDALLNQGPFHFSDVTSPAARALATRLGRNLSVGTNDPYFCGLAATLWSLYSAAGGVFSRNTAKMVFRKIMRRICPAARKRDVEAMVEGVWSVGQPGAKSAGLHEYLKAVLIVLPSGELCLNGQVPIVIKRLEIAVEFAQQHRFETTTPCLSAPVLRAVYKEMRKQGRMGGDDKELGLHAKQDLSPTMTNGVWETLGGTSYTLADPTRSSAIKFIQEHAELSVAENDADVRGPDEEGDHVDGGLDEDDLACSESAP